ncbi:MAG: crossover junction endodeoxyribonuclease RuvC, partial [Geminicoccaceae bacterium]
IVVIEGAAFGVARGNALVSLGELRGVVRVALFEAGLPVVEVAPASLKRYASGRGNASKADVLVAAVKRLGYTGSSDDEADALWLLAMALDQYDEIRSPVPKAQREALSRVGWPAATALVAA